MKPISKIKPGERLLALLGLLACKQDKVTACPSDEQLAAYIDHRLTKQERNVLLKHLNSCSACYQCWLETTALLEEDIQVQKPAHETPLQWLKSFLANNLQSHLRLPVAVPIAVSALICIVLLWPNETIVNVNKSLNDAYAELLSSNQQSVAQITQEFSMLGDEEVLGFSTTEISLVQQAFSSGLLEGRNKLSNYSEPPSNRFITAEKTTRQITSSELWNDYQALGRWIVLLWVTTQLEADSFVWQRHQMIAESFSEKLMHYSESEAQTTVTAIHRLQQHLTSLHNQSDSRQPRLRLQRELKKIIDQLASK